MRLLFTSFVLSMLCAVSAWASPSDQACDEYYGTIFTCGNRQCAKSDPDFQNICVIVPSSRPGRIDPVCDVYYGSVFQCGSKQCAKADPGYQQICVVTANSRPAASTPPPSTPPPGPGPGPGDGADAARVRVKSFSANADCGATPDFDVVTLSPLNPTSGFREESLRLFFNDFSLSTDFPGDYHKNCILDADVLIPAGYRFRPVSAAAEGVYSITPVDESIGFIKVSYEVQPQGFKAERTNATPFTGQGEIKCLAALENKPFVSCSGKESSVRLHTNIDLNLVQYSPGNSQIDIDASRTDVDLSWKWELETCSSFFEGRDFQTRYVAYSGDRINAILRLDGAQGSYTTSSFVGRLYQVTYREGGRRVEGRWSGAGNGGSFSFTLMDESSGQFAGTWRDENQPSRAYSWSGYYR